MRLLVVEDERSLCDAIARGLRRAGMAVDVAYDGLMGHEMAYVTRYEVVVLDRDCSAAIGGTHPAGAAASLRLCVVSYSCLTSRSDE